MSKILRDMRKARATKDLNLSVHVGHKGSVISHVAQGVLRNSRKIVKDHVIWKPEEDRTQGTHEGRTSTMATGGAFGVQD